MSQPRRAVAALLVLAVAGLPAVSSSAAAWLPPQDVSGHSRIQGHTVQLVADAQGALTAVWQGTDDNGNSRVWWASRPEGASRFGSAEPLSSEGYNSYDPALAVNPSGAAVVAWDTVREVEGVNQGLIEGVTRAAAGTESVRFSYAVPPSVEPVDVGIDDAGRVTLACAIHLDSGEGQVAAVTGTAGSSQSQWSGLLPLSAVGTGSFEPRVAVNAAGRATAVWTMPTEAGSVVQASDRAPDGDWPTTAQDLSEPLTLDSFTQYAVVATDAAGGAVVAWPAETSAAEGWLAAAVRQPGAESFDEAFEAGPRLVGNLEDLDAVMTSAGTAAVAWQLEDEGVAGADSERLWVTTLSGDDDATSQAVGDGAPWDIGEPSLAVAPDDTLTVAWAARDEDLPADVDQALFVARGPVGGTLGTAAPIVVSDFLAGAAAASTSDGVSIAHVESAADAVLESLRVRDLDATPPVLTGVTVPATATVGQNLALSAAATDRWAEPTLRWDFGDGGAATGAAATHAYARPGTFQVKVTATDDAGNATSLVRTVIAVAAVVPVVPGGPTDTLAPVLTRARLKPALLPTGTGAELTVTSSEAARVVGRVAVRKNGAWRPVGDKRWMAKAGSNTLRFYGKVAERRLKTGAYRVRLVATDAAGNTSRPVTLGFRVDRG